MNYDERLKELEKELEIWPFDFWDFGYVRTSIRFDLYVFVRNFIFFTNDTRPENYVSFEKIGIENLSLLEDVDLSVRDETLLRRVKIETMEELVNFPSAALFSCYGSSVRILKRLKTLIVDKMDAISVGKTFPKTHSQKPIIVDFHFYETYYEKRREMFSNYLKK